jgi:hypothetical protein
MTVKSAPYYWLECDEPGCGIKSTENSEHTAWSDEGYALDSAIDSDWLAVPGEDKVAKHYCEDHANKHDPDLLAECDGSAACDSLAHVEGCFATNPDFKKD